MGDQLTLLTRQLPLDAAAALAQDAAKRGVSVTISAVELTPHPALEAARSAAPSAKGEIRLAKADTSEIEAARDLAARAGAASTRPRKLASPTPPSSASSTSGLRPRSTSSA